MGKSRGYLEAAGDQAFLKWSLYLQLLADSRDQQPFAWIPEELAISGVLEEACRRCVYAAIGNVVFSEDAPAANAQAEVWSNHRALSCAG